LKVKALKIIERDSAKFNRKEEKQVTTWILTTWDTPVRN
jgi:hypothetical protein